MIDQENEAERYMSNLNLTKDSQTGTRDAPILYMLYNYSVILLCEAGKNTLFFKRCKTIVFVLLIAIVLSMI